MNLPDATVPWHQDTAYMVEGSEHTFIPTAWIPLLDAKGNNGTLQVIQGGHHVDRVLPHHQERKRGKPRSWYVYIDEQDLPDGEIVTCEIHIGSVLFINQLIHHQSTENHSDMIRWSFDFRWQDPALFNGMKNTDCILMRTKSNPQHNVQWPGWTKVSRTELESHEGKTKTRTSTCLDVVVEGPWLKRWTD